MFGSEKQRIHRRIRLAHFPMLKTLNEFDFTFQSLIKKKLLWHLAGLDFIHEHSNVILIGPPGTGEMHLSIALGMKACQVGYRVWFVTAVSLVTQMLEAQRADRLNLFSRRLRHLDVINIDESGYIPFDQRAAILFFQVIAQRYMTGSLIVDSKWTFDGWGEIFAEDPIVASAMIDRLVHHAEIKIVTNEYMLYHTRSINRTWVNGERVSRHPLRAGDQIRIGASALVFHRR